MKTAARLQRSSSDCKTFPVKWSNHPTGAGYYYRLLGSARGFTMFFLYFCYPCGGRAGETDRRGRLRGKLTGINAAYETLAARTPEPVVMWENSFRGGDDDRAGSRTAFLLLLLLLLTTVATPSQGREKKVLQYGAGLIINIPVPEPEVEQVVEEVAENSI